MRNFICNDGNAEILIEAISSQEAARIYVSDGDWHPSDTTWWCTVAVAPEEDPEEVEHHKVAVEPEEPPCPESTVHSWVAPHSLVGGLRENPGVFGHGGGVTINEVCEHCLQGRVHDTWATDPVDGTQGLTSTQYPGRYAYAA